MRNVPPGVSSAGRSFPFVWVFSLVPLPLVAFLLFGVLRHFVLLVHLPSLFPYRPRGFPSPFFASAEFGFPSVSGCGSSYLAGLSRSELRLESCPDLEGKEIRTILTESFVPLLN